MWNHHEFYIVVLNFSCATKCIYKFQNLVLTPRSRNWDSRRDVSPSDTLSEVSNISHCTFRRHTIFLKLSQTLVLRSEVWELIFKFQNNFLRFTNRVFVSKAFSDVNATNFGFTFETWFNFRFWCTYTCHAVYGDEIKQHNTNLMGCIHVLFSHNCILTKNPWYILAPREQTQMSRSTHYPTVIWSIHPAHTLPFSHHCTDSTLTTPNSTQNNE